MASCRYTGSDKQELTAREATASEMEILDTNLKGQSGSQSEQDEDGDRAF